MNNLQHVKTVGEFSCNTYHVKRLCATVNVSPGRVYQLIEQYGGNADSFTREAIFSYIADYYYKGDYDRIFKRWLNTAFTEVSK